MGKFAINVGDSTNTVFTINELSHHIEHKSDILLRAKISHYLKKGYIEKITRGIYALPGREINQFELVNKIYSPSYISFFTALYHHGVIFQVSPSDIYLAYKKSDIKNMDNLGLHIHLKFLKSEILLSPDGLEYKNGYTIASAERAFLDTIYLFPNSYFDNLDHLDHNKISDIIHIYGRKKMMRNRVQKYFPNIK